MYDDVRDDDDDNNNNEAGAYCNHWLVLLPLLQQFRSVHACESDLRSPMLNL